MPCNEHHFVPILDELQQRVDLADPDSPAARRARNWGGPRPGSGPPRGNLNALKHGRFSKRQATLLQAIIEVPEAREALIAITNRNRNRRKQAEEGAGLLLLALLEKIAAAQINQGNDQDKNNQDYLDFLNLTTAQLREILEKRPSLRRSPTKARPQYPPPSPA